MFCIRKGDNEINRLHERSLRIVNNDCERTCEELLSHNQNIHRLANDIFEVPNDLSVGDFKDLFGFKDKYTLYISC